MHCWLLIHSAVLAAHTEAASTAVMASQCCVHHYCLIVSIWPICSGNHLIACCSETVVSPLATTILPVVALVSHVIVGCHHLIIASSVALAMLMQSLFLQLMLLPMVLCHLLLLVAIAIHWLLLFALTVAATTWLLVSKPQLFLELLLAAASWLLLLYTKILFVVVVTALIHSPKATDVLQWRHCCLYK